MQAEGQIREGVRHVEVSADQAVVDAYLGDQVALAVGNPVESAS